MTHSKKAMKAKAKALLASQREFLDSLVALRKKAGISQDEVANRMGVSQSAISQFEHYDANPTLSTIRRYALAVDASISYRVSSSAPLYQEYESRTNNHVSVSGQEAAPPYVDWEKPILA